MTLKEQLIQELEHTPDHILEQVLNYLIFLKSKAIETDSISASNSSTDQF